MLYKMKYIDFNMKDHSSLYYVAIILIVSSHLIHFVKSSTIIIVFQITFIIGYLLLILNSILKKGKIHVSTLLYRGIIIIMLLFLVVPKLW